VGHHITAIIIADPFSADAARAFDLVTVPLLGSPLTLFHIDHYYTAYWQAKRGCATLLDVPNEFPIIFPREGVVLEIVAALTGLPAAKFALIQTEYFGGAGSQWACVFTGAHRDSAGTINGALHALGVVRAPGLDEFDTVGLSAHRYEPEELERYRALCDELGV
jgi:hypothetical protein